ncbi:MAG: hypothetical protein ACK4HF_02465 [Paracoccaceae bacterium]
MKEIPRSSHGHFVVQMVICDSDEDPGQISRCGSIAEYRTRMLVSAEPDTVDVVEQVGPLRWTDKKNEGHSHYLDHVVHKADGRRLGLTDKPYSRVSDEFGDEIAQVTRDGREKGVIDEVFLVTGYARDPVKLFNAELMRGCRDADAPADAEACAVIEPLEGAATLRALTELVGMGPRGFRALVRKISSGELVLLHDEKIFHDSWVRRGGAQHD